MEKGGGVLLDGSLGGVMGSGPSCCWNLLEPPTTPDAAFFNTPLFLSASCITVPFNSWLEEKGNNFLPIVLARS